MLLGTSVPLILQACSSTRVPVLNPPGNVPPRDTVLTVPMNAKWKPESKSGRWHYIIHDSSTVSISNDTTAQARPIESTVSYTLSFTDSADVILLTAQMDSMTVTNQKSPARITTDTIHSRLREIISKQHRPINQRQQSFSCTTASISVAARVQQLVIPLPMIEVDAHSKWADTSTVVVCHGRVALTEFRTNEFKLASSVACKQNNAISIYRTGSSSFTGASAEGTGHLNAGGMATESGILCLDRSTGLLLSSTGESRVDLTVTTSRGIFPFTQNTVTSIQLIQ